MNATISQALQRARRAEKEQALYYRALTARAEDAGDVRAVEDLNGLLADEQHQLSRLTARLLEADETIEDLNDVKAPAVEYPAWQQQARARELDEVERYQQLAALGPDPVTADLVAEIVAVEQQHARVLGGKFMSA